MRLREPHGAQQPNLKCNEQNIENPGETCVTTKATLPLVRKRGQEKVVVERRVTGTEGKHSNNRTMLRVTDGVRHAVPEEVRLHGFHAVNVVRTGAAAENTCARL